jgi:signal transduction histidine kinase
MGRPASFEGRLLLVLAVVVFVATVVWVGVVELGQSAMVDWPVAASLIIAAIVSLASAAVVGLVLVRRIARPIEALAEAADSIAGGTYGVRIPAAGASVELQHLSQAFERMATRLSETEASRTRLLSDLAHEIRTPLATLEAYIDGLEDGIVSADPQAWSTMRDQVLRLRRLTADLRETAAAEEHALGLTLAEVDLRSVVTASGDAVLPMYLAKGVEIAVETGTDPLPVRVDVDRMQQVLANLLGNSLRHTPSGGHVRLAADRRGTSAVISVIDDGEGIPADQLEAVFARFHRVDASRQAADGSGSGLGLTIARAIVSDHGGTVTAASPGVGQGSTLTVTIPLDIAPPTAQRRGLRGPLPTRPR